MYDKVIDPIDVVKKKGQRQVIMALIPRATDVPHLPRQREAKM